MKVQRLFAIPIAIDTITGDQEISEVRSRKIFETYTRPIPRQGSRENEGTERTSSLIIYFMDLQQS